MKLDGADALMLARKWLKEPPKNRAMTLIEDPSVADFAQQAIDHLSLELQGATAERDRLQLQLATVRTVLEEGLREVRRAQVTMAGIRQEMDRLREKLFGPAGHQVHSGLPGKKEEPAGPETTSRVYACGVCKVRLPDLQALQAHWFEAHTWTATIPQETENT